MGEQARARAIVASLGALSAALIAAMLLGVAVVAGPLLRPSVTEPGAGTLRIPAASTVSSAAAAFRPASSTTGPVQRTGRGTRTGGTATAARGKTRDRSPSSAPQTEPAVGVGVGVGPVSAQAGASVGSWGASADGTAHTPAGDASVDVGAGTKDAKKVVKKVDCLVGC